MSDREQTGAKRYWSTAQSSTMDYSAASFFLNVTREDKGWLVSDHDSTVWGFGRTLLEAFTDFWSALHSHLAVCEGQPVSARIARQNERIRWLLEVRDA